MAEANFDIEQLLRTALAPVEPSASLSERLDTRLTELTAVAFDELADWEVAAMRDPRNWARPVAATVGGGRRRYGAGSGPCPAAIQEARSPPPGPGRGLARRLARHPEAAAQVREAG